MAPIQINGNELDPEADRPALRALGIDTDDSSTSDYILIQTQQPLSADQKTAITDAGAKILEYVSKNTYLCHWEPPNLAAITSKDYVTWANIYPQAFVVPPHLKSEATHQVHSVRSLAPALSSSTQREVDIVLHNDLEASNQVKSAVSTAAHVNEGDVVTTRRKFRFKMEEQHLDTVAALDAVYFIEEVLPKRLLNDRARVVMNADDVLINGTLYRGEGEFVAVADTGFDKGSAQRPHAAFTGRVAKLYSLGRPNLADDPDGHGTHVCGSVLGDSFTQSPRLRIQGTAPEAGLVVQSVFSGFDPSGRAGLGGIPADLNDLFTVPYSNDEARVHTNSWGASRPNGYDTSASEIDTFVFEHPQMVICFAAGNDGVDKAPKDGVVDLGQIGSEAFAKNCITVGASENNRPELEITYSDITGRFTLPPIANDLYANKPSGMAAFSSRGSALVQGKPIRIKPDIVAPGTGILSTRSRGMSPESLIAQEIDRFGVPPDAGWLYLAGTSMATPLVAGCCAVLRESLIRDPQTHLRRPAVKPTAALIKALLINGAVELLGQYPQSEAGRSPNPSSGWGRVSLANSIIVPGADDPNAGCGEGDPLPEGKSHTFSIHIPDGGPGPDSTNPQTPITRAGGGRGLTFKITLVWTDKPAPLLQNNLNLIVRVAGRERHGNRDEGDPSFDEANNVEQVVWEDVPAGGVVEVTVNAAHFATGGSQSYAYAWKIFRS